MESHTLIPSFLPSIHRYFASTVPLAISDIHGDSAEIAISGEIIRGRGAQMYYTGRAYGHDLDNYWADLLRKLIVYRAEHGDLIQVDEVSGIFDGTMKVIEGVYGLEVVAVPH